LQTLLYDILQTPRNTTVHGSKFVHGNYPAYHILTKPLTTVTQSIRHRSGHTVSRGYRIWSK